MPAIKGGTKLQNLVQVDDAQLDKILAQIPRSLSIMENLKATLGVSFLGAKAEIQATPPLSVSTARKVRRLEAHLEKNGLINRSRPRRTPRDILNGSQYWWVKETFIARRLVLPTPALLEKFGVAALVVWISDPKRAPKPKDDWDWTGSFLYLPTVHFEDGKTTAFLSGCSALQFVVNAAQDRPLLAPDWDEPFGRTTNEHPIQKLSKLGAFVTEERKLESLYYVRYITDEQLYSPNGSEVRVNDIVGYPIYIAAFPAVANSPARKRLSRDGHVVNCPGQTDNHVKR
jgi:hypothetical protein